jgi:hypothetical protein
MLGVGDTIHIPSGAVGLHLFAVILGPIQIKQMGSAAQYVLVNFSSTREGDMHDDACEVLAGEHPAISRASHVVYRYAQIKRADDLQKMLDLGVHRMSTPCSPELLTKIRAGALRSKRLNLEIKRLLQT